MRTLTILAATAIATSLAASPVLAKDAAPHSDKQKTMKVHKAGKQARAPQFRNDRAAGLSYEPGYNRGFERRATYDQSYGYDRGYNDDGFWPANVAANIVTGAVDTAGAVATAPFRNTYAYDAGYDDSYAYTPAPVYRSTWNDNATGAWNTNWDNNWASQSYAQRNGFVCTPGTWFTNSSGYSQICQ